VLAESVDRLLRELSPDALVLDIGGWARPLARADWVMDLLPYETRGVYGRDGSDERFTRETWIERDICERTPYPFADDSVDFVVCSHTLEDIRDPIWVCSEMNRVARAGYIEVPSRLEEQTMGVHGPWVGWSHHRWLIDVGDGRIDFTMKPHFLHGREGDHFPRGFHSTLSPRERVQALWWSGSFEYSERVMVGSSEIDRYVADFVSQHNSRADAWDGRLRRRAGALRRRLRRGAR
jgi:hypothetical protein